MNSLTLDILVFALRAMTVSTAVGLAAAGGLWLLRHHRARVRVRLIRFAFVALLVGFLGSLPVWPHESGPITRDIEITQLDDGTEVVTEFAEGWVLPRQFTLLATLALGTVWSIGLATLFLGLREIRRLTANSTRVGPHIFESNAITSPVTVGAFRPVTLLPMGARSRPDAALVVAHEQAHARARDPLWLLVAASMRATLFFQPLVHWLARRLDFEQELAADDHVVSEGTNPHDYARALLDWAEIRVGRSRWLPVAGFSGPQLEQRVVQLIRPGAARSGGFRLVVATLLLACALLTIGRGLPAIAVDGMGADRAIEEIETS